VPDVGCIWSEPEPPTRGAHCQDGKVASSSTAAQVTDASIWHINADEPSVLDYNAELSHPGR